MNRVASHDTSGAAAKTVTRAERPRRPRMQQEMMKDEADGHYVKMKADGHFVKELGLSVETRLRSSG